MITLQILHSENIFSQKSSSTGFFNFTPTNIGLIITGSILVLFLIGAIIWRVFFFKKTKEYKNQKELGSIDPEFHPFIVSISNEDGIKILHNILFKNKYAKQKFSVIPALIILNNKLFLISNLVKNNSKNEIVIDKNTLDIVEKGKKEIIHDKVRLDWYNDIFKFFKKEFGEEISIQKVLIFKNKPKKISNDTDFLDTCIFDFLENIERSEVAPTSKILQAKIVNRFMEKNIWKQKTTELN